MKWITDNATVTRGGIFLDMRSSRAWIIFYFIFRDRDHDGAFYILSDFDKHTHFPFYSRTSSKSFSFSLIAEPGKRVI